MMRLLFLASGSKGNATLIATERSFIQIDMGVSLKTLKKGCAFFDKTIEDIQALFITHEHADHVSGVPLLHGKVPLYASEGTLKEENVHLIEDGVAVEFEDISMLPFAASHDAANPMNFLLLQPGLKFGYVTDTGILFEGGEALLKNCDGYLFESNHDLKMLRLSSRPPCLKRRIRGEQGHLSNLQAAEYLSDLIGEKTKKIFLAHLSEECNTPETALQTFEKVFTRNEVDFPMENIVPTKQWEFVDGGQWQ